MELFRYANRKPLIFPFFDSFQNTFKFGARVCHRILMPMQILIYPRCQLSGAPAVSGSGVAVGRAEES
jgi:hypothetical protein